MNPLKLLLIAALTASCGGSGLVNVSASADYGSPVVSGTVESPDIKESSGLSASECQDVLWTHNDAGNEAFIYGMDLTGKHLGTWRVTGATNTDWESIATIRDQAGKRHLLIADIGDNEEARSELTVYRIPEPAANGETAAVTSAKPLETAPAEALKYTYSDGRNNAEAILAHPGTGDIYIVTKKKSGPAGVYKIKPEFGSGATLTAQKIAEIRVPSKPEGLITGSSYSPDGRRVMLCDVKSGYELVLPDGAASHDEIWTQTPNVVDLGDRKQGEGVSYGRDGVTVYASSEKKNPPIYVIKRNKG